MDLWILLLVFTCFWHGCFLQVWQLFEQSIHPCLLIRILVMGAQTSTSLAANSPAGRCNLSNVSESDAWTTLNGSSRYGEAAALLRVSPRWLNFSPRFKESLKWLKLISLTWICDFSGHYPQFSMIIIKCPVGQGNQQNRPLSCDADNGLIHEIWSE